MRKRALRGIGFLALALAMLCSFAAGAAAESPPAREPGIGIGGTGHQPGEGNGIGGTGGPQQRSTATTGIVGTVTGFGSILVNGFEVDYSDRTPTRSDLDNLPDAKALRVGQVVEIEAEGEGKRLRARNMAVRYEVAGPVESIDRASGNVRVLGQTVAAGQSIIGTSRPGSLNDLAAGDTVNVSGLRRADGVIVASRIDKAPAGSPAWLRGRVENAGSHGFTLSGVRISRSGSAPIPAAGEEAAVLGAYNAGTFRPAKIVRLPKEPFAGRIAHLSIEGFVRAHNGNGRFIGGLNLGEAGAAAKLRAGDRVIVDGKIGEHGRLVPDAVRPSQFNRATLQRGGLRRSSGPAVGRDGRSPAAGRAGAGRTRKEHWVPHRQMHHDVRPGLSRGTFRHGHGR